MADDCLFCKIILKEIPATVIFEDDKVLAFNDIKPAAPIHVLLIPKVHVRSVVEVVDDDPIISILAHRAAQVAKMLEIEADGFRLVFNNGRNGGQTVDHLHLHLLGGRFMTWPPG